MPLSRTQRAKLGVRTKGRPQQQDEVTERDLRLMEEGATDLVFEDPDTGERVIIPRDVIVQPMHKNRDTGLVTVVYFEDAP